MIVTSMTIPFVLAIAMVGAAPAVAAGARSNLADTMLADLASGHRALRCAVVLEGRGGGAAAALALDAGRREFGAGLTAALALDLDFSTGSPRAWTDDARAAAFEIGLLPPNLDRASTDFWAGVVFARLMQRDAPATPRKTPALTVMDETARARMRDHIARRGAFIAGTCGEFVDRPVERLQ